MDNITTCVNDDFQVAGCGLWVVEEKLPALGKMKVFYKTSCKLFSQPQLATNEGSKLQVVVVNNITTSLIESV